MLYIRLYLLLAQQRAASLPSPALEALGRLGGSLVHKAVLKFKRGKSSADDILVAEMLLACDEDICVYIATLFILRILNVYSEDDETTLGICMLSP